MDPLDGPPVPVKHRAQRLHDRKTAHDDPPKGSQTR
jgi:hypothetical protein